MKFNKTFWNQKYREGRIYAEVSEIVLDQVLPELPGTVLDIGCGTGILMRQLKKRGFTPTGIDLSDVGIHQAKQLDPEMTYLTGDFMKAELGTFDVVIANKVLAFNDIQAFLSRVSEILVHGGTFILITPVTRSMYATKYSERLRSISVDYDELNEALLKHFGHSVQLIDRRHFGDYGEELTIIATK